MNFQRVTFFTLAIILAILNSFDCACVNTRQLPNCGSDRIQLFVDATMDGSLVPYHVSIQPDVHSCCNLCYDTVTCFGFTYRKSTNRCNFFNTVAMISDHDEDDYYAGYY